MALAYFAFMVCLEVTFLTIGLYWLLQRILKSSSMVKYLPGPSKYTPQELPSFLYSNALPCPSLETHIPSLTMLSHLPPPPNVHEYGSSPAATLQRGGAVYPIRPLHHPMDLSGPAELGTDTRREYIPLSSQDIYYGCPIPGIYSPYLSMANHAWYENSFGGSLGGPVPSLDGSSARFRERPGHSGYPNLYEYSFEGPFGGPVPFVDGLSPRIRDYGWPTWYESSFGGPLEGPISSFNGLPARHGESPVLYGYPTWYESGGPAASLGELTARLGERSRSARYGYPPCGGGLTPSATPTFEQPADDYVEAHEKSNTIGGKACGCACRAQGLGKDAPEAPADHPLAAELKGHDSIPVKIFERFINMQRCPRPPEENFECRSKGVDKDAPADNLLATDENNQGSFPDHVSGAAMLTEVSPVKPEKIFEGLI